MKDYGQFCGLAKAGSVLGERWSLLILRDLSIGPRRFKDLLEGLPGIPTSVLTTRLRELQSAGVIDRTAQDRPGGGVLYGLTPHGQGLLPILDAIGRWGSATMVSPADDDVITDASLAAALRAAFRPGAVRVATTYAVHAGPASAWAIVEPDRAIVGEGEPGGPPDLTIRTGPQLRLLLAGRMTPADALSSGAVRHTGPPAAFDDFIRAFHVPLADTAGTP